MTTKQQNIATTWILIPVTILLMLYLQNRDNMLWVVAGLIGFGICKYYRKDLPEPPERPFNDMSGGAQILSLIYYLLLVATILYIVLEHPKSIDYGNDLQFIVLLIALFLPLIPGTIRRELYLYKLSGKENT